MPPCRRRSAWPPVQRVAAQARRRGQDPSLRTNVHGCFVGSGLDRSAGWADISRLARRGGIHAAREPCAAANTPGGINSSPTHCPQTIFCMAGRRGRRPLPPHFVCAQRKLHLFYYLLSFISYLFKRSFYDCFRLHQPASAIQIRSG